MNYLETELETMDLENALIMLKENTDHAWDLSLQDGERFEKFSRYLLHSYNSYKLLFQKDGFRIEMITSPLRRIHIEIYFPWYFCFFHEWVGTLSDNIIKTWSKQTRGGIDQINVPLRKGRTSATGFTREGPVQAMLYFSRIHPRRSQSCSGNVIRMNLW